MVQSSGTLLYEIKICSSTRRTYSTDRVSHVHYFEKNRLQSCCWHYKNKIILWSDTCMSYNSSKCAGGATSRMRRQKSSMYWLVSDFFSRG